MQYEIVIPDKIQRIIDKKCDYFEKRWRILFEIDEIEKVIIIVGFKHKDEMS